jgi:hypothetical protein
MELFEGGYGCIGLTQCGKSADEQLEPGGT